MVNVVLTLLGLGLMGVTLPLVIEMLVVTAGNALPEIDSISVDQSDDIEADHEADLAGTNSVPSTRFHLAIIVPAHNEELLVSRCVSSLRASTVAETRIFVVAHNCVDATAARASAAGAEVLVYNDPTAVGKGFALRYGFAHALSHGFNAVMVVDADSTVSTNTVPAVLHAFGSGARIVQCRYEMESTTPRSSTRLAALAFRAFNVVRPRGRSRLGLSAGILGNGFAILAPVLRVVPYEAFSVVEDLEYHLHLVMAGESVEYLDKAIISADFPESRVGESVQRSRWEGGRLLTARVWALPILGKILSGKFLLIEPLFDLAGLPTAFGVLALVVAACLPLVWLRWYSAFGLSVIVIHVLTAAWAGPNFIQTLQLLALSPFYILRKLLMVPGVLRGSSAKAAWVRTERDNTL